MGGFYAALKTAKCNYVHFLHFFIDFVGKMTVSQMRKSPYCLLATTPEVSRGNLHDHQPIAIKIPSADDERVWVTLKISEQESE